MEEEQDVQEVQETPEEEAVAEAEEAEEVVEEEVDIEDLKKRADASSQNFERAKKAEAELKAARAAQQEIPKGDDLTTADILYLAKADIHEDDMDELRDWAKFKNIGIKEAHNQLKPTFAVKNEQRKTASATNTGRGVRATTKNTGEDLLRRAEEKGEVPETEEGMRKLAEARLARKKAAFR
jgi:hypothetical protein